MENPQEQDMTHEMESGDKSNPQQGFHLDGCSHEGIVSTQNN